MKLQLQWFCLRRGGTFKAFSVAVGLCEMPGYLIRVPGTPQVLNNPENTASSSAPGSLSTLSPRKCVAKCMGT